MEKNKGTHCHLSLINSLLIGCAIISGEYYRENAGIWIINTTLISLLLNGRFSSHFSSNSRKKLFIKNLFWYQKTRIPFFIFLELYLIFQRIFSNIYIFFIVFQWLCFSSFLSSSIILMNHICFLFRSDRSKYHFSDNCNLSFPTHRKFSNSLNYNYQINSQKQVKFKLKEQRN